MSCDDLSRSLERDGESVVRDKVARCLYSSAERARVVLWLEEQERERFLAAAEKRDALMRSSVIAAWAAAAVSLVGAILSFVNVVFR